MPKVLDIARKRTVTFVELTYGSAPTFTRYCDADENTTFEGNVYLSRPTMAVRLVPYTGMLVEKSPEIILPKDTFTDELTDGRSHTPVTIRIVVSLESDVPGTPVDDVQELFKGLVSITIRNKAGRPDQMALRCITWKHQSDRPCGFQANGQCFFRFQERGCVVDSPPGSGSFISAVTLTTPAVRLVIVSAVVDLALTLTGSPSGGPFADLIFHRGFFERDDLKIGIREWDPVADDKVFLLERAAPPDWSGQVVALHQGCDKSLLTCQNRYSNDDFFGGFGAGIPDYNPIFEVRN